MVLKSRHTKRKQNMKKLLTQKQALAVGNAMTALASVGVSFGDVGISANRAQDDLRIQWMDGVTVCRGELSGQREEYESQAAFAAAYELTEAA